MNLVQAMNIASFGMKAQGTRLRVISENLANANSEAPAPGTDPYRRKIVTFKNQLDRAMGANLVQVNRVRLDESDFELRHDPNHPHADTNGYVRMPNVKPIIEMMDMREAQRSYEANLSVIETSRSMLQRTADMLRA